jgi:hypothetical protein
MYIIKLINWIKFDFLIVGLTVLALMILIYSQIVLLPLIVITFYTMLCIGLQTITNIRNEP